MFNPLKRKPEHSHDLDEPQAVTMTINQPQAPVADPMMMDLNYRLAIINTLHATSHVTYELDAVRSLATNHPRFFS